MKKDTKVKEEAKELTVIESPVDLAKPERDTKFAHESAKLLVDIIEKNNWARQLGGQSKHIQYEGWQTVGKYYGYAVKTGDAEPVEIAGIQGFKAHASVVNETTGIIVGGAEAYCMRDEYNWKSKPVFQLASMAQTRAGSKALRQILGFVVALAGYSPTPQEEMAAEPIVVPQKPFVQVPSIPIPITSMQKTDVMVLLGKKGKNMSDLSNAIEKGFKKALLKDLTSSEANRLIDKLRSLPDKKEESNGAVGHFESADEIEGVEEIDLDEIDEGIEKERIK